MSAIECARAVIRRSAPGPKRKLAGLLSVPIYAFTVYEFKDLPNRDYPVGDVGTGGVSTIGPSFVQDSAALRKTLWTAALSGTSQLLGKLIRTPQPNAN